MKHRHTFFIKENTKPPPEAVNIVPKKRNGSSTVTIKHLKAAQEWKVTIDAEDLDSKLAELRKGRYTLQFVGKHARGIPDPLQRGFVKGIHVLWLEPPELHNLPFIGSLLPDEYKPIQLIDNLSYLHIQKLSSTHMDTLLQTLWSFLSGKTDPLLLPQLAHADVIEFDILPHSQIQLRALWSSAPHAEGWRLNITSYGDTRVEVGIFEKGSGEDKDEYALEGLRAVLDVHGDFEPTLFTFPHRHHVLKSGEITTILDPAYGSHPVLRSQLPRSAFRGPVENTLDHESCQLHALYTLPKEVFVDKYQLAQLSQFKSGGIEDIRGIWGETDLEDPTYKTRGWGSVVLLDVSKSDNSTTLELPLHLRYLEPVDGGGKTQVDLLPPELFWACENTLEDFNVSPFGSSSRSLLHTMFPEHAVFYHLINHVAYPRSDGILSLDVPVADSSKGTLVQNLTVFGILLGFTYLFITGAKVGIKGLRWRGKGKEKAKDQ